MKIQTLIAGCLLLFACRKSNINSNLPGLWKVEKIEIMRNGELKKIINESSQYWNISLKDSIRIFTPQQFQNSFPITLSDSSIQSPSDEFMIDKLSSQRLELSSSKKHPDANYTVIYYLDRVEEAN